MLSKFSLYMLQKNCPPSPWQPYFGQIIKIILILELNPGSSEYKTNVLIIMSQVLPGCVAQSVTCLATDACLTADQGVASSIPARSHTFVEIDHEMISTVILLPSADYS